MKKIASLLLTVVMLAAMLTVFAVPAFAEGPGSPNIEPPTKKDREVTLVGQWILPYDVWQTPGCYSTYGYVVEQIGSTITYAIYYVEGGIAKKDANPINYSVHNGGITRITAESVPKAIRDRAAQDYPDLVPTGSILSEGSLTIIVGVAAAAVFGLGGFFIGKAAEKKKKPATAGGETTDEE